MDFRKIKAICIKDNDFSRLEYQEYQETLGAKFLIEFNKRIKSLSDFKYAEINAKFKVLCHNVFPNDLDTKCEPKEQNKAISRKKNKLLNFCSNIKNDTKKLISNMQITKRIKENNRKLLKIPRVLCNSINERKKKLSLSKSKIKRKSVIVCKKMLNVADPSTRRKLIDQTTKFLASRNDNQMIAAQSAEICSIDSQTILIKKPHRLEVSKQQPYVFISPIVPLKTKATNLSVKDSFNFSKYTTINYSIFTSEKISEESSYKTVNSSFSEKNETFTCKKDCLDSNRTYNKSTTQHSSLITQDDSDESDEDIELQKAIPEWSKKDYVIQRANHQAFSQINFTKLFSVASSDNQISLDDVFKIKKKRFNQRTSSANWNIPPIWENDSGNGEMSYMVLKNRIDNSELN